MSEEKTINQESQISIKNLDEKLLREIKEHCKQHKITYSELFTPMWNNFKISHVVFSDSEKALIDKASKLSILPMDEIKKQVILRASKNIITNGGYLRNQKEVDINSRTSSKAAYTRASQIVEAIIAQNDLAKEWYDKKHINQRSIDLYAKKLREQSSKNLTLNLNVIKRYLDANKEKLEEHHLKHGIAIDHNRKVFNYLKTMKNQLAK